MFNQDDILEACWQLTDKFVARLKSEAFPIIWDGKTKKAQALKAQVYDLVLMDCLMPEMDGFEATRRIRLQSEYGAQAPIVAMTANAFVEDRQACLAAGMSDYLSKPVRQSELEKKLNLWLRTEPALPHAAQEI